MQKKYKRKLHIDSVRLGTSISRLPLYHAYSVSVPLYLPLWVLPASLSTTHTHTHPLNSSIVFFRQHICQFFFHSLRFFCWVQCAPSHVFFFILIYHFTHTHIRIHTFTQIFLCKFVYSFAHRRPNLTHSHTYREFLYESRAFNSLGYEAKECAHILQSPYNKFLYVNRFKRYVF